MDAMNSDGLDLVPCRKFSKETALTVRAFTTCPLLFTTKWLLLETSRPAHKP